MLKLLGHKIVKTVRSQSIIVKNALSQIALILLSYFLTSTVLARKHRFELSVEKLCRTLLQQVSFPFYADDDEAFKFNVSLVC